MGTKTMVGGFDDDWLSKFWQLAMPRFDLSAVFEQASAAQALNHQWRALRAMQDGFAAAKLEVPKLELPAVNFPDPAVGTGAFLQRMAIAEVWKPLLARNWHTLLRDALEEVSTAADARAEFLSEERLSAIYTTLALADEQLRLSLAAQESASYEPDDAPMTRHQKLSLLITLATLLVTLYLGTGGNAAAVGNSSVVEGNQVNIESIEVTIDEINIESKTAEPDWDKLEEQMSAIILDVIARLPEEELDALSEEASAEVQRDMGEGDEEE